MVDALFVIIELKYRRHYLNNTFFNKLQVNTYSVNPQLII